jgi:hypothetical protein
MSKICILDGTGHTEVNWDKGDPGSLLIAAQTFKRLQGEGYAAFELKENGETEGVVDSFNPNASEITFLRQFAGG